MLRSHHHVWRDSRRRLSVSLLPTSELDDSSSSVLFCSSSTPRSLLSSTHAHTYVHISRDSLSSSLLLIFHPSLTSGQSLLLLLLLLLSPSSSSSCSRRSHSLTHTIIHTHTSPTHPDMRYHHHSVISWTPRPPPVFVGRQSS